MAKDAAVMVRLPQSLKGALEARREHRSLSAQIAAYLERGVAGEPVVADASGRLLGLFEGGPLPSDADFTRARRLLWVLSGREHRLLTGA